MPETIKKITKKDNYLKIREIVENSTVATEEAEDQKNMLVNFIDKRIEELDNKAEKAKERAEKKKNEADELKDVVYNVLTDQYQTADAILSQIEGEDLTKAKITARLTKLFKEGLIEKTLVKEDSRKITAYRIVLQ